MRQVRILSRAESLLRDPATGSFNLAAAQGTWFELSPPRADERYELSMLGLTIAGPGVTANLDGFGGTAGQLELAVNVHDGYSAVRDMAALTPETFGADGEWGRGAHTGTFADREAGVALDGSDRVGLRGMPAAVSASPAPARWTSPTLDVLYGTEIVAVSWECWRLLNSSGNTVAAPTIELLTGTRGGPALINWAAAQTVASSAAEIERGHADLAAPAAGDVYRWRITLPFVDPGVAIEAGQSTVHTATFFSLCAWIRLAEPRWRFRSAGELLERSEISRHVGTGGWSGGAEDVMLLRVPMSIALRGRLGEKVSARLTGGALSLLEIYPAVDLRFEGTVTVPTGIEETLAVAAAALAAAIEAGAATSPLAGVQDPAGSAMDASNAAALGVQDVMPSSDALDGDSSVLAPGAGDSPISGDRPPDGSARSSVTEYEFEPLEILARGAPADDPADAAGDQPAAAAPAEVPPLQPPTDPGGFVPTPPGQLTPQPPGFSDDSQAPPAGEREPEAPDGMPPSVPEQEPGPWAAGLADRWERNVTWAPSAIFFGESGEATNRRTKKKIENWLSANLLDDDLEQSEGERIVKGVLAGVVKTATDVALDMVVTPMLDPGTVPRGIMRTGVASAQGMEDIEQGKTLEGTMKIVGEVSSVVLMVAAPVRAGGIKGIARTGEIPGAGAASGRPIAVRAVTEPSITTSLERLNLPKTPGEIAESKTAHNVVEVNAPGAPARRTHAIKDVQDGQAVAQVVEYSPTRPPTAEAALKAIQGETPYDYFTRPMTPAEAQRAIATMDNALNSSYGGWPGRIGPYAAYAEHCATHAAAVARAGGIWTTGRLGSYTNFVLFKYMSPLGAQNLAALTAQAQVANTNYPR